ncbi:ribose-phosphate pyrophosphokinase [Mesomycoplasma lagogenitalium]|uniref:Ribose-phosphate pyrophosphokinase n=1 Tax=Mesomycoplasma lagogenitalium TaxID=171286 RepID=A0ABY8LVB3_9BACT|nr:ribose-phosphate pyrophosphokinase [Mesomycoplasma lagogenitalium]WGI36705.1 ribose-phosphate pyrophosphokinase [Mesomycoplasma lagogenitalium]
MSNTERNVLFGMENSLNLAQKISERVKLPLTPIKKEVFADGEILLSSTETVRNSNVFIVASTHTPVNDNIMELLIFIDSLKRASAKEITVILSYYGYARQDRKAKGRQPIAAKLVANLLETAGATKIIAVDLHNPSIQGFFNIPLDDLRGQYVLARRLREKHKDFTVVSPDHGGAVRARILSELISDSVKIAIIDKRRVGTNQIEVLGMIGTIDSEHAVLVDDIIDTGGTILNAAKIVKEHGAKTVTIVATHGIFSKGFEAFEQSEYVDKVIISDSIDRTQLLEKYTKLEVVSLCDFISQVIIATINRSSVSDIYKGFRNDL